MCNIIVCYYEYMDGFGYFKGVKGDEVLVEVCIVIVVDIFDVFIYEWFYKKFWLIFDVLVELWKMVDLGKLDENCVNVLVLLMNDVCFIVKEYNDF